MTADASEVLKLLYMVLCILPAAACVYALRKRKLSRLYRGGLLLSALLFTALAALFGWLCDDYRADAEALAALSSHDTVTVEKTSGGWRFDGPGEDTALIFYPGAKVDPAAYAPLLFRLAEGGADGFLQEMPLKLALFDRDAADRIISNYQYENWILAGHSLGGVAASDYAGAHADRVKGLLLLASYPTKALDGRLAFLSVRGDRDGVLNRERYEKSRVLWPQGAQELVIPGGSHAGFGCYGPQKGDGEAALSAREQQELTAAAVLSWIGQGDAKENTAAAFPEAWDLRIAVAPDLHLDPDNSNKSPAPNRRGVCLSHVSQKINRNDEEDHPGDAKSPGDDAGENVDRDLKVKKAADEVCREEQRKAADRVDKQLEDLLDGRCEDAHQHVQRHDHRRGEENQFHSIHIKTPDRTYLFIMSRPAQTKTGQFSGGRDRDSPSRIRILYGYTENGKMSSGMGPCPHGEMTAAAGAGR